MAGRLTSDCKQAAGGDKVGGGIERNLGLVKPGGQLEDVARDGVVTLAE